MTEFEQAIGKALKALGDDPKQLADVDRAGDLNDRRPACGGAQTNDGRWGSARGGIMPRSAVALVVSLLLGIADARAEPARDAAGLVDTLMHVALQSLRDKQLTPRARQERFATILENDFDLPRFAQFVTGRYWNTANQTDRQQFVGVLERWIIVTYSERFSSYAGDGLKVTGSRPDSGTTATVSSQLARSDGSPINIEWRVRHQADDYRVVDVSVEGVSMLLTHREEFGSVIQKNGGTVAALTRALENKLADSDGAASRHCQGSC